MDIRLRTDTLELDGRTYTLRCNMNVLADVQEAWDGDLLEALDGRHRLRSALSFCAAMCNDWAKEQGWDERWTPEALGRRVSVYMPGTFADKVMGLVFDALAPADEPEGTEADEKN